MKKIYRFSFISLIITLLLPIISCSKGKFPKTMDEAINKMESKGYELVAIDVTKEDSIVGEFYIRMDMGGCVVYAKFIAILFDSSKSAKQYVKDNQEWIDGYVSEFGKEYEGFTSIQKGKWFIMGTKETIDDFIA